jgi:two-component system LytT family response regulator
MKPIRALIVDDEEPARSVIREYLGSHPEIRIVAECGDALEALDAVDAYVPDLIFLDVQMPEVDGFEFLSRLENPPVIIFCTAFDEYAVKAFEVSALDYLLKPFQKERFDQAVQRAVNAIQKPLINKEQLRNFLRILDMDKKSLRRILVKQLGRWQLLETRDIMWIEAMEDYVCVHTASDSHLVHQTMSGLESKLDPEQFIRIHRSYMINIAGLKEMVTETHNRWTCLLKDGTRLPVSRSGQKRLKDWNT